jgi:hypothetical protein
MGGLAPEDIVAGYDNRDSAVERAMRELFFIRRKTKQRAAKLK